MLASMTIFTLLKGYDHTTLLLLQAAVLLVVEKWYVRKSEWKSGHEKQPPNNCAGEDVVEEIFEEKKGRGDLVD